MIAGNLHWFLLHILIKANIKGAINELNDTEIKGRQIFVREDREDRELQ